MSFRMQGVVQFAIDRGLDFVAIASRAEIAVLEHGDGSEENFSGGDLEKVMGNAADARAFQDARELNSARYGNS